MGRRRRYRFVIDEAFTPDTLPMWRLAQYMADVATLLGEPAQVHFVSVEGGSAVLVQDVEHEAYPKVRQRVEAVNRDDGPPEAARAYELLNRRLAEDNASGRLLEDGDPDRSDSQVLLFPGARQEAELEYGPVVQASTLQGVVIRVGGENDPVPVHLQDVDVVHNCHAKRVVAKELARHIFGRTLRVSGNGRWSRDAGGQWSMRRFLISEFTELEDEPLRSVVTDLREATGAAQEPAHALQTLRTLRRNAN